MKKAYLVFSAALNRNVFIADQKAAEKFAEEQTEHTGTPHAAEPVEIHEDAAKLNEQIDQAHRSRIIVGMNAGERRAFGIKALGSTVIAKPADAQDAEADDFTHV